jgi:hypothetical protein
MKRQCLAFTYGLLVSLASSLVTATLIFESVIAQYSGPMICYVFMNNFVQHCPAGCIAQLSSLVATWFNLDATLLTTLF